MKPRFFPCWLCFALALFLTSASAVAQSDPDEAEYQRAAQLRSSDPEAAITVYRALHERTHAPRALAQIAILEAQLGRWLLADEHLSTALEASTDAWIQSRRAALENTQNEIRSHVSELIVAANVEGATLRVNGASAGVLPLARGVRVLVGQVVIDLEAPGYEPLRQIVQSTPGRTRIELQLVPVLTRTTPVVPPPPPPPPPPTPVRSETPRDETPISSVVGPLVLLSVGTVAIGTSVALYVLQSDAVGICTVLTDAIECPTPEAERRAQSAHSYGVSGAVTLGIGTASAAAGLTWFIVSRVTNRSERRAQWNMQPITAPAVLGLRVSATF